MSVTKNVTVPVGRRSAVRAKLAHGAQWGELLAQPGRDELVDPARDAGDPSARALRDRGARGRGSRLRRRARPSTARAGSGRRGRPSRSGPHGGHPCRSTHSSQSPARPCVSPYAPRGSRRRAMARSRETAGPRAPRRPRPWPAGTRHEESFALRVDPWAALVVHRGSDQLAMADEYVVVRVPQPPQHARRPLDVREEEEVTGPAGRSRTGRSSHPHLLGAKAASVAGFQDGLEPLEVAAGPSLGRLAEERTAEGEELAGVRLGLDEYECPVARRLEAVADRHAHGSRDRREGELACPARRRSPRASTPRACRGTSAPR